MRTRTLILAALLVALLPFASYRGHAQDGKAAAVGMMFIDARDGARNVTISRKGAVLAYVQLPKGTMLGAVDEHRRHTHLGDGRFEFHGDFELRALPLNDARSVVPSGSMPALELMSHAPLVLQPRLDMHRLGWLAQMLANCTSAA